MLIFTILFLKLLPALSSFFFMLEFTVKRIPGASMCVIIQVDTHLTRFLSWSAVHMAIPRCVLGGETAEASFLISPVF